MKLKKHQFETQKRRKGSFRFFETFFPCFFTPITIILNKTILKKHLKISLLGAGSPNSKPQHNNQLKVYADDEGDSLGLVAQSLGPRDK